MPARPAAQSPFQGKGIGRKMLEEDQQPQAPKAGGWPCAWPREGSRVLTPAFLGVQSQRGASAGYHNLILLCSQSTGRPGPRLRPAAAAPDPGSSGRSQGTDSQKKPCRTLWEGVGGRGGSRVQEGYGEGTHPRVLAIISTPAANFPSPLRPQFPHLYRGMVVLSADFKGL